MHRRIRHVAFLVRDQDEALAFFVDKLGFVVTEDTRLGGKRWLTVAPEAGGTPSLLLSAAATPEQRRAVGRQAGGRVFLFLETDDLERDHRRLEEAGVVFVEPPRAEPYGTVAVFRDLYGNRWDLLQPASAEGDAEPQR